MRPRNERNPVSCSRCLAPSFRFIALSLIGGVLGTLICAGPAAVLNRAWSSRASRFEWRTYGNEPDYVTGAILRGRPFVDRWALTYSYSFSRSRGPRGDHIDKSPPYWAGPVSRTKFMELRAPEWIATTGAGWPFRAFSYIEWASYSVPGLVPNTSAPDNFEGGWWLKNIDSDGTTVPLIVPYTPIWPGLIGDLVVWSALTAFALPGVKRLRAAHRRRRGRCESCTYPRAGLAPATPCPECGRATGRAR